MAVEHAEVDEQPSTAHRGLHWHVLILGIGLVAVWPLLNLGGVFSSDEGSYALQARVLSEGTWDMGYAFIEEDPEGRFLPFRHSEIVDGRVTVDTRHPFWPVVLSGPVWVLGEGVGLRILGVVSVVGLATVAWVMTAMIGGPRAAPWAFWVAAASPVLANAWLLWAHAPSAAVAGLLAFAGLACRRHAVWVAAAAGLAVVTVLLRPEGLIWAVAVALALVVLGAGWTQRACGAVVGVSAAVGWVVEARWVDALSGTHDPQVAPRTAGAETVERGSGLMLALFGQESGDTVVLLLGVLALGLVAAAVVVVRLGRSAIDPAVLVAGGAVALGTRLLAAPTDPLIGLLVAAPALLFALAVPRLERAAWFVPAAGVLFLGAVGLSIHPDGGGFQWGGRYLSPVVGVVAVLVGCALASGLQRRPARPLGFALVALLLVQAIAMVAGPDAVRGRHERGIAHLAALGPSVTITAGDLLARHGWAAWPDRCWLAVPRRPQVEDVAAAFDVLARTGVTRLSYARMNPELLEAAGARVEATDGLAGVIALDPQPVRSAISPPYTCGGEPR